MVETNTKISIGSVAISSILAIVVMFGFVGQTDVWVCEDLELAMRCDSMSKVNDDGLITRCYYYSEEKQRDTYKTCKSGWIEYVSDEKDDIVEDNQLEVNDIKLNSTSDSVYLLCNRQNALVSHCQIVDSNDTLYHLNYEK